MIVFYLIWEDIGDGRKAKLAQKDKMSQHIKSNWHLPPCFLSPLHSSPRLCVNFWSISWVAAAVIPLVLRLLLSLILGWKCLLFSWSAIKGAWVVIWTRWVSLESSAILIFLFIVVWLGLERNWLSFFLRPQTSPLHHLWEPLCKLPSCVTCSSPYSSILFLTLPLKLYSVFLVDWV